MRNDEKPFNQPRLSLSRIYTRGGDWGETSLVGGQRVPKDSIRIQCYGTVDELNAFLGLSAASIAELLPRHPSLEPLSAIVRRVQHELFNLGSILATRPEDIHPRQPRITGGDIAQLEREIDSMNAELGVLNSFVLPGGCRLNAELHVCRTVCRRAERLAVSLAQQEGVDAETLQYLNRLSDALFVWSRWVSARMGVAEVLWQPNESASAGGSSQAR